MHRHHGLGASRGRLQNRPRAHVLMLSRGLSSRPPEEKGPYGRYESRDVGRARHRNLCGPGSLACLRAQPFDSVRVIPPPEFVVTELRFWGVEPLLAARYPCSKIVHADTRRLAPGRARRWRNTSPHNQHLLPRPQTPLHRSYRRGSCAFPRRPRPLDEHCYPRGRASRHLDFGVPPQVSLT